MCDKKKLSPEDLIGLQQEISILQSLGHDHIVRLYDVYNDPNHCYLVLEYMAGGDLIGRIVSLKSYTEHDAIHVCIQIVQALEYCHDQNVAHRDIKLENILLATGVEEEKTADALYTVSSTIKLGDFGFASRLSEGGFKTQCGTPLYVAPEILKGKKYGCAVDMWSLGVLVYILLCGYPPFHDKDTQKIFKSICSGQVSFHGKYWRNISVEAKEFIKALLTVEPSQRLSAKDARNHAWLAIPQDSTTLQSMSLTDINVQERLRIFNVKKKLRAAVYTVIVTNKFTSLGIHLHSALAELS